MGTLLQALLTLVTAAVLMLAALSAHAQQAKSVEGVVIQFGLMSAERAVRAEGHRDAGGREERQANRRRGSGVEAVDPKGASEKKALIHTSAAGMPDYSELFVFGGIRCPSPPCARMRSR
jgi:hypothetical protein